MDVMIISDETKTYPNAGTYRIVHATCGKKTATVMVSENWIQVVCENASHKAWRGMGRSFPSLAAAREGYKSSEMRAIIDILAD